MSLDKISYSNPDFKSKGILNRKWQSKFPIKEETICLDHGSRQSRGGGADEKQKTIAKGGSILMQLFVNLGMNLENSFAVEKNIFEIYY